MLDSESHPSHSSHARGAAQQQAEALPSPVAQLWARRTANPGDTDAVEQLVIHYRPLVNSEVHRARAKFPRHVDADELDAAGLESLFMAIDGYDPSFGTTFEGYARRRIWGAILDRVRSMDGTPRTVRRASKVLNGAVNSFLQRTGRHPGMEELAEEAEVTPEELKHLERYSRMSARLSLDAVSSGGSSEHEDSYATAAGLSNDRVVDPLTSITNQETKAALVKGLEALPDRERAILVLHYHEGIMFNEIAAAMNVSESRISQIHGRALERLKRFMTCRE